MGWREYCQAAARHAGESTWAHWDTEQCVSDGLASLLIVARHFHIMLRAVQAGLGLQSVRLAPALSRGLATEWRDDPHVRTTEQEQV